MVGKNLPATADQFKSLVLAEDESGIPSAFIPKSIPEAIDFVMFLVKAEMLPTAFRRGGKWNGEPEPEKAAAAILRGLEVGLKPMAALRNIYVVNGMPTIWGDSAMGLIHRHNLVEDFVVTVLGAEKGAGPARTAGQMPDYEPTISDFGDDFGYRVDMKRRGTATPFWGEFTVRDARRAGLWKKHDVWLKHPKPMLFARARSIPQRMGFSDALGGLAITEEARDHALVTGGHEPEKKRDLGFLTKSTATVHQVKALGAPADQPIGQVAPTETAEPVTTGDPQARAEEGAVGIADSSAGRAEEDDAEFLPVASTADGPDFKGWATAAAERIRAITVPRKVDAWIAAHEIPLAQLKTAGENGSKWHARLIEVAEQHKAELYGNSL